MKRGRASWWHNVHPVEDEPRVLPEAKTWAELSGLSVNEAVELVSDVIAGRRPVRDLPDWKLAMEGDEFALERIVRAFEMRKVMHRLSIDT